jgi:HEPN domain-containing protein
MPPESAEVRRWLVKAQHDWSVARKIVHGGGPEYDVAAFHCQQAIEKMLKAFLVSRRTSFEKIHDLGRLLDYCAGCDQELEALRDGVEPMTIFAIAFRYPGPADPSAHDVSQALSVVQRVWSEVAARLNPDEVP